MHRRLDFRPLPAGATLEGWRRPILGVVAAATVLVMASATSASVLYENPDSGFSLTHTPIWYDPAHNFNYAGNSFTVTSSSIVTGVDFASWTFSNDPIKEVSWAILDGQLGLGNILAKGEAAVSADFKFVNFYTADIADNIFTIPDLTLGAGAYWLYLSQAVTINGDFASWDNTSNGTSLFVNGSGRTYGNTFRILGEEMVRDPGGGGNPCNTNLPLACGGDPSGAVPEPAAWALMIVGFGLAGATLRRRSGAVVGSPRRQERAV